MAKLPNRGYDPDNFLASKKIVDVIYLKVDGKEVGRYCKCGCGKKIEGKLVKQKNWRSGKINEYYLPPMKHQLYATRGCMIRHRSKMQGTKWKSSGFNCRLSFKVDLVNNIPCRKLTVYVGKTMKKVFLITEKDKEIWEYLERISRYKQLTPTETPMKNHKSTGILPNENIHQTVNNICEKIPQAEQS